MRTSIDPRVERTRGRALDAARRLLVEHGVDAVTHLEVARRSDVGRRTMYRHWPDRDALLRDVLAHDEVPHPPRTGELRADLIAHLDALRRAILDGHLGYVVCLLGERSVVDPSFEPLRRELTEAGCAVLHDILCEAMAAGSLPGDLDVDSAAAALEGPVFYRAMIRRQPIAAGDVERLVDAFLHGCT